MWTAGPVTVRHSGGIPHGNTNDNAAIGGGVDVKVGAEVSLAKLSAGTVGTLGIRPSKTQNIILTQKKQKNNHTFD